MAIDWSKTNKVDWSQTGKIDWSNPSATKPTSNFATEWLGIQNPDTYWQDSWNQFKKVATTNPLETIGGALSAGAGAITGAFKNVTKQPGNILSNYTGNKPVVNKIADFANALGADVGAVFSPVSSIFAAAEQIPVLKQAADVVNGVFTVTGNIVKFPVEGFVNSLPIDQESKDVLAPAFGDLGALAGQIVLGGKVMSYVQGKLIKAKPGETIVIPKEDIVKLKEEAKVYTEKAKTEVVKNRQPVEPIDIGEQITNKYKSGKLITDEGNIAIEVVKIRTDLDKARQGFGTKMLNDLKQYSDEIGKPIVLDAKADLTSRTPISQKQLETFYEKNGFKKLDKENYPTTRKVVGQPYVYEPKTTEVPKIQIPVEKVNSEMQTLQGKPNIEPATHKSTTDYFNRNLETNYENLKEIALGNKEAPPGTTRVGLAELFGNREFNPKLTVEEALRLGEIPDVARVAGRELEAAKMGRGTGNIVDVIRDIKEAMEKTAEKIIPSKAKVSEIINSLICKT
jgi:GNAT superfamily N-acetyltransferase